MFEVFELTLATIADDALFIASSVFAFTPAAIDDVPALFQTLFEMAVVEALAYPIAKVLSKLAKSPPPILPQVIVAGQTPSV